VTLTGPRGSYDALLLVSFGGPEGPEDVVPFLEKVTAGRGIPRERLIEVGAHYAHFGGVSPINDQNRALLAALRTDLAAHDVDLPVYWGNRNWHPSLAEALREMRAAGVGSALCLMTSAYASYSGCRQYRENLADAVAEVEADGLGPAPRLDKLRHFFDHPGFLDPMVDGVVASVRSLAEQGVTAPRLVFTTHSIPVASADSSGPTGGAYVAQHREVAALVSRAVAEQVDVDEGWDLVYQSRSGAPGIPWLEPDISDHLDQVKAQGATGAVIVPVGFVSDHIEVLWDLDRVALDHARDIGLPAARSSTAGTDPRFVAMVRELALERVGLGVPQARSPLGPSHDVCPGGCCPNPRGPRPALCGADAS